MKLWKSKKSAATSCVSAVSGKLNLSGNKNGYKDDTQNETVSATPTNQSAIHLANGLHQGKMKIATACGRFFYSPLDRLASISLFAAEKLDTFSF